MQQEFTEISHLISQQTSSVPSQTNQDGLYHHDQAGRLHQQPVSPDASPAGPSQPVPAPTAHGIGVLSASLAINASSDITPASQQHSHGLIPIAASPAGKRIIDYENAMLSLSPKRPLGFEVTRKSSQDDLTLPELPNEVWEHVMCNLDPKTHKAMALVSRRFHRLESTQLTWRMAFMNHFPGQKGMVGYSEKNTWYDELAPSRPSVRFFVRMSQMGSWREEYALRTSLLQALSRGKAHSDFHACSARPNNRAHRFPTLTYWPKLGSSVTHLDAVFSDEKDKPPMAIHGNAATGECSTAIPLTGRVLKTTATNLATYRDWDSHAIPYGLGEGPVAVPNVMSVSQRFGSVAFESYPGGIGLYQPPTGEFQRLVHRPLAQFNDPSDPRRDDCATAAWIAKSHTICNLSRGLVGILAGSAMGFVSAFSLEGTGTDSMKGETVAWAVSPGVPIVSIIVDEQYTQKRASAGQAWAVILNALGEVFTLVDVPRQRPGHLDAWAVGRSAYWHLVPPTRRKARLDNVDDNENAVEVAAKRTASPRSSASFHNLSPEQLLRESQQINEFCRLTPSNIKKRCLGWDMRRRLEVDFAAGNGTNSVEQVFVLSCGLESDCPSEVRRFSKRCTSTIPGSDSVNFKPQNDSIFGAGSLSTGTGELDASWKMPSGGSLVNYDEAVSGTDWLADVFSLGKHGQDSITAAAIDMSNTALRTVGDEDLHADLATSAILPGCRARWFAIGTDSGAVVVWDGRSASPSGQSISPIRVIQTESPGVSCLAISSLFVVHGGTDGRLQTWDPLCSTLEYVRILNAKQRSQPILTANHHQAIRNTGPSVRAIYLDPDSTKLRGLAAYGHVVRCWSYGATNHVASRKRCHRYADAHHAHSGRRRQSGRMAKYIDAEHADIERDIQEAKQQRAMLRNRFLLGDLSEEEALQYAQVLSEETAAEDERRRATDLDTSNSDGLSTNETESDVTSIFISNHPGPAAALALGDESSDSGSATALTRSVMRPDRDEGSGDSEGREMELAIRLSLHDVDNTQVGESSRTNQVLVDDNVPTAALPNEGEDADEELALPAEITEEEDVELRMALIASLRESRNVSEVEVAKDPSTPPNREEDDLKMALELSMQEEQGHLGGASRMPVMDDEEAFPDLGGASGGKGKGKGKARADGGSPSAGAKGKGGGAGKKGKKGKWTTWSP